MNGTVSDWTLVNKEMSESLRQERLSGPAMISNMTLDEHRISLSIAGFRIVVSTAIEMTDGKRHVGAIDADHRHRREGSFEICKVVGKIVSRCFCDDSGLHVKTECGLVLSCRCDGELEQCRVIFPYAEGGECTFVLAIDASQRLIVTRVAGV